MISILKRFWRRIAHVIFCYGHLLFAILIGGITYMVSDKAQGLQWGPAFVQYHLESMAFGMAFTGQLSYCLALLVTWRIPLAQGGSFIDPAAAVVMIPRVMRSLVIAGMLVIGTIGTHEYLQSRCMLDRYRDTCRFGVYDWTDFWSCVIGVAMVVVPSVYLERYAIKNKEKLLAVLTEAQKRTPA